MLAPNNPEAILLCRYTHYLVRGALVPKSHVRRLVADFDALHRRPHPKFTSCGQGVNPIVARLYYANGHVVTIWVRTAWCAYATNGDVGFSWPKAPLLRLLRVLERLTQ